MYNAVYQTLSTRMIKRGIARSVRVELPLRSPREVVKWLWSHEFCTMGSDTESGAIETSAKAAPKPIRVTWHPMLHFDDDASIDWAAVAANGGLPFTVGAGVGQSFSLSVNSCIGDEDRRSAIASLRRSIDRR